jgi:cysteinyl-tRNA synthetase
MKLYNSLTRTKEDFVPIHSDRVGVYACGPTVYNYAHIGNARMAVAFDTLVRALRYHYPRVVHVCNITDVDDKIMIAAKETGRTITEITTHYTLIYNNDMPALGNLPPDVQPRATEHIPEMIMLMEQMIANGHAYVAEGHVLFNVPSYPLYGALSGNSRDDQIAGARVDVAPYKKDPADFVLWKPSASDQPGWESPWGRGRPGWHIECSAMAEKHLGLPFDIHGGGADLKFPHHENEIAQSCCAHSNGADEFNPAAFARVWVHNGFVTVEGDKMSKSIGNVTLPHDLLLRGVKGEVMRWALLSAHYRAPLDWSEERLNVAKKHLDDFYTLLALAEEQGLTPDLATKDMIDPQLIDAIDDDLNTPLAQTRLIQLYQNINAAKPEPRQVLMLLASARFMGLLMQTPALWFADRTAQRAKINADWVAQKISERTSAKVSRDFARGDAIRDELTALGIELQDTKDGATTWTFKN